MSWSSGTVVQRSTGRNKILRQHRLEPRGLTKKYQKGMLGPMLLDTQVACCGNGLLCQFGQGTPETCLCLHRGVLHQRLLPLITGTLHHAVPPESLDRIHCPNGEDAYRQPHPIAHIHWRFSQPQVGLLQLHPHPQRCTDAVGHCCHHRAQPKHMLPVCRCSGYPACGCGQVQPTGGGVSIIGQSPESLLGLVGERQAPDPSKQLEDG
jgi:hypothetical protein